MFDPLYEAAVAEVRNQATNVQVELLNSDLDDWMDALERVLDEIDAQFSYRERVFNDETEFMNHSDSKFARKVEEYNDWKKGARTFYKHINARLSNLRREAGYGEVELSDLLRAIRALREADKADDDQGFDEALEYLYNLIDSSD